MIRYQRTQTARWPYLVIVASGGTMLAMAAIPEPMPGWVRAMLVGTALLVVVVMLVARSLTVEITNEIDLWFGWGWPRKRIDPSSVLAVRVVRNRWWDGWGIRWVSGGSLWNVSGLDAVELTLEGGSVFRIGTDEPELLRLAVASATGRA